jgi:hypothetical protein
LGESATLDFLAWIDARERTYAETIDAWRTSCPRLSVWDDAVTGRLVRVVRGSDSSAPTVVLTARGRSALSGSSLLEP